MSVTTATMALLVASLVTKRVNASPTLPSDYLHDAEEFQMHELQLECVSPETEFPLPRFRGRPSQGVFELRWSDKRLRLVAFAQVDKSDQNARPDPQQLGQALVKLITQGRASAFSKNDVAETQGTISLSAMVTVNAETLATLEEEAAHDKAVRECFNRTVQRLRNCCEAVADGTYENAFTDLAYIEDVLECGYLQYEAKWYDSKLAAIRANVGNCKDATLIRQDLHGFHAPRAWIDYPPILLARAGKNYIA